MNDGVVIHDRGPIVAARNPLPRREVVDIVAEAIRDTLPSIPDAPPVLADGAAERLAEEIVTRQTHARALKDFPQEDGA